MPPNGLTLRSNTLRRPRRNRRPETVAALVALKFASVLGLRSLICFLVHALGCGPRLMAISERHNRWRAVGMPRRHRPSLQRAIASETYRGKAQCASLLLHP